ncbi:MAG: hypothetical protein WCX22_10750 [Methanoregula sp.]
MSNGMEKLVGLIIPIILGFALIGIGVSSLGQNALIGIGFIVAGLAAIVLGLKMLV